MGLQARGDGMKANMATCSVRCWGGFTGRIRKNATQYGLSGLFNGIGGSIQAPASIEETDMKIETGSGIL